MKTDLRSRTREIERAAKALDAIEANVAVLDNQGLIITTNKAWRDFANKNFKLFNIVFICWKNINMIPSNPRKQSDIGLI